MAITADKAIEAILKVWYKDGVENLLFRNSPVLKEIGKTRVEGKQQNFAAMYSRGGAVGGDFLVAADTAASNVKNAEFQVVPGQLFSVFSYNAKEVQSSLSKRGAYMKVAGNKAFAAAESLRKTLAAALYGTGYGELAVVGSTNATAINGATLPGDVDVVLPESVIMKIDVGSKLVLKSSVTSGTEAVTATVKKITGSTVTLTFAAAYTASATDVIALKGSMDASGNPLLPIGLGAWLPYKQARSNATWDSYISTPFFGVNRSVNADALAGNFFYDSTNTTYKADVQALLRKVRRHGSEADLIVMNDADWLKLADEIQASNTYFTQTSTRSRREANIGMDKLSASFSTNFIDLVYDDPYCPEGVFYVLDKKDVELWAYTNTTEAQEDGISGNNPGKQNVEDFDNKGKENDPYKLIIDDFITTEPGTATSDGPAVRVTLQLYGSFVVLNPSNAGVGLFHDAATADLVNY